VDATYQPVDKLAKDASHDRDAVIVRDYPLPLDDLVSLLPSRSIPLVLIKANVWHCFESTSGLISAGTDLELRRIKVISLFIPLARNNSSTAA
jgi:hypothetical protein